MERGKERQLLFMKLAAILTFQHASTECHKIYVTTLIKKFGSEFADEIPTEVIKEVLTWKVGHDPSYSKTYLARFADTINAHLPDGSLKGFPERYLILKEVIVDFKPPASKSKALPSIRDFLQSILRRHSLIFSDKFTVIFGPLVQLVKQYLIFQF